MPGFKLFFAFLGRLGGEKEVISCFDGSQGKNIYKMYMFSMDRPAL